MRNTYTRWTHQKYLLAHLLALLCALTWPQISWAGPYQQMFADWAWEIIVLVVLVTVPAGAWLGAAVPPPQGRRQIKEWSFAARFVAGLLMGYLAAWGIGSIMNPLAFTVVPPAVFSAFGGAGLIAAIRDKQLRQVDEDKGND